MWDACLANAKYSYSHLIFLLITHLDLPVITATMQWHFFPDDHKAHRLAIRYVNLMYNISTFVTYPFTEQPQESEPIHDQNFCIPFLLHPKMEN